MLLPPKVFGNEVALIMGGTGPEQGDPTWLSALFESVGP